ncbi:NUDIX domain-containing protein [Candidatus Parcubacteria bacterium]|jgi:ADP-ribose pyrophosphatase YjhB (NUDIX family)|nr:MAG: NUDIX domain-containing protein [Candidatus Parcubacteria bacterium]
MGHTRISPQVVVLRHNQQGYEEVLLIQRADTGIWTIPGGTVETGESLEQAAIRETKEETGYDVSLIHQVGKYSLPHMQFLGEAIVFVGKINGGESKIGLESTQVVWFNVNRLPYKLLPFQKPKIKDALAGKTKINKELPTTTWQVLRHYLIFPRIFFRLLKFYRKYKK